MPAFKQEKTIGRDLKRIHSILEKLRYNAELICVDDGSPDDTFKEAKKAVKSLSNVEIVRYEVNKGKGYAVRFGMAKSKGDIIAFVDAGMDINPNGLSMLLEHFEWYGADIIVGSKRHPASKVYYPWQRRIMSMCYQLFTRVLFGLKIKDTQVGIKFYKREVLEKVLPRLLVKQFAFDIEILAVANYLGFKRIYEGPIEMELQWGEKSSITNKRFLHTVFRMIWDTIAVFYRLFILGYYADRNKKNWVQDPDLFFSSH